MFFYDAIVTLGVIIFGLHASADASAISARSPSVATVAINATYDAVDYLATPKLRHRPVGTAGRVGDALGRLFVAIQNGLRDDNEDRSQFTQDYVTEMHEKFPEYNWVICHTKHSYKFHGAKGVEWAHWHKEFDIKVGGTIGYEIYNFRSGEFTREGDGGYLNWAYIGRVVKTDQGGKHLVFGEP